ncbi:MAG: hypothetical protein GWO24_18930 [Akkermansiaceae bacterium]|nr:hypothetical protein [Akkermansiaceae bacterium]
MGESGLSSLAILSLPVNGVVAARISQMGTIIAANGDKLYIDQVTTGMCVVGLLLCRRRRGQLGLAALM